ncbi:MAG: endonuclease/exonuclease/phosphatase family metal-dependent hydrolase [Marivirga sp.]|jgi:endonuclease/exonuclease/phosphatase family metal-dependent hydrolase
MKKNNLQLLLISFLVVLFTSCEDESNNIIIIDNGNPSEEETGGNEDGDAVDTTATDVVRNWDLFQPYSCYEDLSANSFNIVTWNIEWFPKRAGSTISRLADLINSTNADVIAMQEVAEPDQLATLVAALPGWNYKVYDVRGDQELGYLYKESEIASISELSIIYPNNTSAFYRPPVIVEVEHINGQKITLFNIHLKCCGGSQNVARRKEASELLKDYIDNNLANEKVIVLGDFNDEITGSDNPFENFVADSAKYYFADTEIATGNYQYWSYPGFGQFGSHIDHVLISNELFDDVTAISTLAYDECISSYDYYVSDHRPLIISID